MTPSLFRVGLCSVLLGLSLSGCKTAADSASAASEGPTETVRPVAALQLYPNFAEIKSRVQLLGGQYVLHGEADPYLLTGTAALEGVNVLSQTMTGGEGWLNSLEGQEMTLYVNGAPKTVTLIRARDLLVKDWNGKYRRIKADQLAFNRPPPIAGQSSSQTLTFQADGGPTATLSYLTRGLGWSPRYTLSLQGNAATLTALADIRNPSDQIYDIKQTELISGDVNIYGVEAQTANAELAVPSMPTTSGVSRTGTPIIPLGELRGLHRFKLDRPFSLAARSTTSLPFLTPKITPERLNTIQTYFSTNADSGVARRSYRLKADAYLPAGEVLIRDEGRVVGQQNLPETAAGDPVVLELGNDPELSYTRTVQTVQRDPTGATFKVTYILKNAKATPARVRVSESLDQFAGRVMKLTGDAVRDDNAATFAAELPAGGSLSRSFTVDARIRSQN